MNLIFSAKPSAWQRRRPRSTTLAVASTPRIEATPRNFTRKRMPAPLQQQRSTPVEAGPDPGALRQVHRGLEAADVDLLAHDQFPEVPLRAAIDGLDVLQANIIDRFHSQFSVG